MNQCCAASKIDVGRQAGDELMLGSKQVMN
jgi:hypothetical protein